MFEAFISICALVICCLSYLGMCWLIGEAYKEHMDEDAKRMALITSIEQLRKISQRRKLRKTQKRRLKSTN